MINSIIKILNLKEEDMDSIESISTINSEDFIITLKQKDHICPNCGSITNRVKDYSIRTLHHKIFIHFNSTIYYKSRRYFCSACNKSFMERNPFGNARRCVLPATVKKILEDLKPYNSTFSSVAKTYGISVSTVISLFDKHVQIPRKKFTSILCWDEFYFNRHAKYKYAFMIMDFNKKTILDIVESRHIDILSVYFYNIPIKERESVKYIIIDMYKNYADLAGIYFPKAIICIDPFHAVKQINSSLNSFRKRIMRKYQDDKKSINYKLLKYRYRILLKNYSELEIEKKNYDKILGYKITERDLLNIILSIDPKLKTAYLLKEKYITFNSSDPEDFISRESKNEELNSLIKEMLETGINEMKKCAETCNKWKNEILNSFIWIDGRRLSNGPIEGKNTYIKKIIGNANGFHNFERARNKFLYSQNLFDSFSLYEHKAPIKMSGKKRGKYKKRKK